MLLLSMYFVLDFTSGTNISIIKKSVDNWGSGDFADTLRM